MKAKASVKVVKDIDPKKFDELRSRIDGNLDQVLVGFPGKKSHDDSELTVAQIATVHEFGNPEQGIPERSFLRSGVNENRKKYTRLNADSISKILRGQMSMVTSLGLLGKMAKSDVQKKLTNGPFQALKPATVKRKGSSKPLIDSGQLRQSVAWEIKGND